VMIFVAAWKTAGSGQGKDWGIEVNLGYDDQGSGEIEPGLPIGAEDAKDDENPPKQIEQEQPEPQPEEAKDTESKTFTDPNSDVEIKEEKKDEKKEDVKKDIKPVEKIVEKKPEEKPVEKVEKPVEKVTEKPKIDEKAVYKGKTSATGGDGEGRKGTTGNQGDDVGKEGNKGVEGGTEGAAVYKGKPGGGDGGTLLLDGWDWDHIPQPVTPENELPGRIVFLIEVNEEGELIGYRKESGTVSAAAERACVAAIQKLTFTKKPGAKVPSISKGKITFVVRNK